MKQWYYTSITTLLLGMPSVALGRDLNNANDLLGEVRDGAGIRAETTLDVAVGSAISIVLSLVGLIFLILMVYAGVLWLTARGEQSQVDKARKMISTTIIGLILTISAYAITALVIGRLGVG